MTLLMNTKEAAKVLGVSDTMMIRWRAEGTGPRYVKYGDARKGAVRYQLDDLTKYIQQSIIEPA